MSKFKNTAGFKFEMDGTDCFVSKGKFCSSLASLQMTGVLEDSRMMDSIEVPESVQIEAEIFVLANGW